MSRYPGGIIRKTPVTPAGPFQNGAAPGMWTLAEASFWTKQGLWPIAGNLAPVVEDAFSTYLYTGTGSSAQTITNGINLSGQGGLVWIKARSQAYGHRLYDTIRGGGYAFLDTASSGGSAGSAAPNVFDFSSSGFVLGTASASVELNNLNQTFTSWTFRQEPKFFDVVTYTGNGANRTIAHNLGVAPGMILVKRTDTTGDWQVYHRSNANTQYMVLNSTAAVATGATRWNSTTPTATEFSVGTDATVNASGGTYVAYLFAHNTASDGFIQCGSFTTDGSGYANVNLGYEPQWIMYKPSGSTGSWGMGDVMRGMPASTTTTGTGNSTQRLFANTSSAEGAETNYVCNVNSTGFTFHSGGYPSSTFIYVAIRRGPMRTPTLGTSVFNAQANLLTDANKITTGFVTDWFWERGNYTGTESFRVSQRLTQTQLVFTSTAAEGGPYGAPYLMFDYNDGFLSNLSGNINPGLMYGFRRAPGFMDVVCYTGNGSISQTVNHNLGVEPELIILKCRNVSNDGGATNGSIWNVAVKAGSTAIHFAIVGSQGLNFNGASTWSEPWVNISATATSFLPYYITGAFTTTPAGATSGNTYVAYLFASAPGVSKVGSYTGNGSSQTINCAFTTGARFVLIKRTDSAGDWYVWDSARGIVAGNDPYLALNTTAAQVTSNDSVDTDNTGFIVNQVAASNINVNAATYIFLAIA